MSWKRKGAELPARHLLVTNDFPPKTGGIQSYLWELWRRLPPDSFSVLTSDWPGAAEFDAAQPFEIRRLPLNRLLFPDPGLARRVSAVVEEIGAQLVVFDPAFPTALMGAALGVPYAVVVHGAEVNVPAHLPGARSALARAVRGAALVIASSAWALRRTEAAVGQALERSEVILPGVDHERFRPVGEAERASLRRSFGLDAEGTLVLSLSRLVPRKGMDVLVKAVAELRGDRPELSLAIAGQGRDRDRICRIASRRGVPLHMLGPVAPERIGPLLASADVFAMLCRDRWGGLEQEGFGIVFLEAAACGVAQVAGLSGGSAEAVVDGESGILVRDPTNVAEAAAALAALVDDPPRRAEMGRRARQRVLGELRHDLAAERLAAAIAGLCAPGPPEPLR